MEKSINEENQKKMEKGEAKTGIPEKGAPENLKRESQSINNDDLQNSFYNFTVNPKLDNLNKQNS